MQQNNENQSSNNKEWGIEVIHCFVLWHRPQERLVSGGTGPPPDDRNASLIPMAKRNPERGKGKKKTKKGWPAKREDKMEEWERGGKGSMDGWRKVISQCLTWFWFIFGRLRLTGKRNSSTKICRASTIPKAAARWSKLWISDSCGGSQAEVGHQTQEKLMEEGMKEWKEIWMVFEKTRAKGANAGFLGESQRWTFTEAMIKSKSKKWERKKARRKERKRTDRWTVGPVEGWMDGGIEKGDDGMGESEINTQTSKLHESSIQRWIHPSKRRMKKKR